MSLYVLSISNLHGITDICIIRADSDKEVADYIINNVKNLYYPFFEFIVKSINDLEFDDINDLAKYLHGKYFEIDTNYIKDKVIEDITYFLKDQSPENIFQIMTFYEETGNKEDAVMRIKKPNEKYYTCNFVDLNKLS